jgi:hypothetical protein
MNDQLREELIEGVRIRTGAADRDLPGRALIAVVSLLGGVLPRHDAEWLCRDEPTPPERRRIASADDLHQAVSKRLGVPMGRAVEITETVLAVLAASLPDELLLRMKKHLPASLAEELDSTREVARVQHHAPRSGYHDNLAEGRPGSRDSVAEGRAGSKHPISEAKPFR